MASSHAAAVLLPLFEIGGIAYATYTLIYLVGVQYLLDPSPELFIKPRKATGIALIVVYCLLLLFCLIAFLRMVQVIWMNPGLVPLGDPATEKEQASRKHFDQWCDSCHNWKPDRAHHSTQQGRCVRRMDHFCPYAGGIISETSHKFFVQFLFYGSLYTGFVLIVMAVFLAERGSQVGPSFPSRYLEPSLMRAA
jgi:palmitoyltransferase